MLTISFALHREAILAKMSALVFILLGCFVWLSKADDISISTYALKMEGVCAKASDIENYGVVCTNSSSSIFPNKMPSPLPTISADAELVIKKQNDLIMKQLIDRALYNSKVPIHNPKYGFQQLSTMFAIYGNLCPVVPPSFLQTVFHLFSFLHSTTATDRTEVLLKAHHKWIMRLLNNCTMKAKELPILTDLCKETAIASENCTSYICTNPKHEFRLMKADPIVDIVFKAHELVQAVCFPDFRESYRMFHFMHLTVMDTINEDLKNRWALQIGNYNFWKRLLGPHFATHLINIERCNKIGMSNVKFRYRIPRNSLPSRIRLSGIRNKFA